MKALFAAITLLSAVAASAQTSPSFAPPPGQATGNAPPAASAGFRGGDDYDDDDYSELRRSRRGTLVVVEREDLEKRLADLEELLGEAFDKRGNSSKKKLREAYEELKDIRDLVADAPEVRRRRGGNNNPGPIPPPAPVYQPIAEGKLQKLMSTMSREPFADDKLSVLEEAGSTQYFLVGQVQQVLNQFQHSQDRLKAVRFLWTRVLDRDNGFNLYNSFQFSQDKAELKRILAN